MGRKSRSEEIVEMVHTYQEEMGVTAVDIDAVATWAINRGKYSRPPKSMKQQAKEDISRALRASRHTDPQGRVVRTMHPVPVPSLLGEQQQLEFVWVDMRDAQPIEMRSALAYRRQLILSDVKRHKDDTDSYNENNRHGEQIGLFDYDFNKDVQEASMPATYDEEALAADLDDALELLEKAE